MLVELKPKKSHSKNMVVCGAAVVMQHLHLTAVLRMKKVTIQNSNGEKLILVCTSVYSVFMVMILV